MTIQVCRIHPYQFFLFPNIVAHERIGAFIFRFGRKCQQFTLLDDDGFEGLEYGSHGSRTVGDVSLFCNIRQLKVFAVGVDGDMIEGKDALCNFINFQDEVVVQFFKFEVKFKKFLSADVPVKPSNIHVKYLIVG